MYQFRVKLFAMLFRLIFKLLPKESPERNYMNNAGCNIVQHHIMKGTKDYFSSNPWRFIRK